jgi:GDPmannose 4,6-dehydratase
MGQSLLGPVSLTYVMKTALITGITGQDGSYLAELLLTKGYSVVGAVRNIQNAKELLPTVLLQSVELVVWNMLDQCRMTEVLAEYHPAEIYNLAASSSGAGMFNDAVDIGEVNGLAAARILEAIRAVDSNIRFCQASSSEMFGNALESPQSESTPFRPRTPYGAAKLYAHSMIQIYRQHYGIYGCSAILFNHESPRRGLGFVTRKITHEVAKIKLGLANELCLGNLEARRDWGFAGDYVRAMWLMLQHPQADDYVVATGETHSVRELCEIAFRHLNLDYRNYVSEDPASYRPIESVQLVGNSKKLRNQLGWIPEVRFQEMINRMVDADLRELIEQDSAKG